VSNIVSVIVPIYNVAAYLPSCLDSILEQERECRLDVVLVDDGSTDDSASIAEAYAEKHSCMRLIRQANGGLGYARNVGASHAAGDYLTFVDSDDIVPKGAYGAMMRALADPDIDFSSGNVLRLKGRHTSASNTHQESHVRDLLSTHVSEHTALLWDLGAWNKIFRRRFWEEHDLTFPEGVLYEEQESMTRVHLLARRVAVLKQVCYLWRVRTEWPPSITQRRYEIRNLTDRFAAILSIFQTMDRYGTVPVRRAFENKILTNDIPLYIRQYQVTESAEYRRTLIDYVDQVLDLCASESLDRIKSVDRTRYWLIRQGREGELPAINACERTHFDTCALTIRERRVFRTYPLSNEAVQPIPASLTDVTSELAPHTCVYEVRREGRDLRMDVHAFVPGISPEASRAMTRRFYLRNPESGRHIELAAEALAADVPTSMLQILHFDGAWSRVRLRVPVDAFIAQIGDGSALASQWEAWVDCELEGLTWSERVRRRDIEYANLERYVDCGDVRVSAGLTREDRLYVRVDPKVAQARPVGAPDEDGFTIDFLHAEPTSAALIVSSVHGPLHELALNLGADGSWLVPSTQLTAAMTRSGLSRGILSLRTSTGEHRVIAGLGLEHQWTAPDGYLMWVGADAEGYVTAFRRQGGCQITELSLSDRGVLQLRLEATDPAIDLNDLQIEIVGGDSNTRLPLARIDQRDSTRHQIDLARINRWGIEAPVSAGDWHVAARATALTEAYYEPLVTARVRTIMPLRQSSVVGITVRATDAGKVVLRVGANWPAHADLLAKRRRLETDFYPTLRRQRPTQSIVFQSWAGAEFSDGPRRVYEELARRVPHARMTWIVQDSSVWVPSGVDRVLRGTREYFEAIARARYVVSNTPMPEHFEKADGCAYIQLGRGIPVKRIGKDVKGLASLTPSSTRAQINDAKRWDLLVTGHADASSIYRRAFEYDGTVQNTGQPRLDRLVAADAPERRQRIRATLGVDPSERIVLYVPTWRDNLFAGPGRYVMPQGLEMTRLVDELGDGWRLLVKNHPYVGDRTREALDGRVINAHGYREIADLYLAADVLVTDYSSATFDFAVTRKPILVFAPDLEEFQEKIRGTYWDMEKDLPGPVVRSTGALVERLLDLPAIEAQWQGRYDDFRARFCSMEDGRAAQRVIESVFTDWLDLAQRVA
jgi:CDP-glycerol glycerophosphotransferase